jgi:predicted Rossmann fold nucleotide-binding protein DprA/Smf involved in DNA uptake
MSHITAIAGSRSTTHAQASLVHRVTSAIIKSGSVISVGCAKGVDQAALRCCLAANHPVNIQAAFFANGSGSCSASNVSGVSQAHQAGHPVTYWPQSSAQVPLVARLARRTQAVVATASAALVAFQFSTQSRGTALAVKAAIKKGLPVYLFAPGLGAHHLPQLPGGAWVPSGGKGVWATAYTWAASNKQSSMF